MKQKILWNDQVQLIFSDVDDTIAEVYTLAIPEITQALEKIVSEKCVLFLVTGGGLKSVQERITDAIQPKFRKNILLAVCSGTEVWGFDRKGHLLSKAYYSLYEETLLDEQKKKFREIIQQVIQEFHLKPYPPIGSREKFSEITHYDPYAVMLSDRRSQITLQLTNAHSLSPAQAKELHVPLIHGQYDWRYPIAERANKLLEEYHIPITGRIVSITAIDFAVKGASKTTAIDWVLGNDAIMSSFNLKSKELFQHPEFMEIWGDKFSTIHGGTDRYICEGLPKKVRAIDFREENPDEFLPGYNIQIWNGQKHLHHGLLEYLQTKEK